MSAYAPLGTDWLSWHFQRIYNLSEYLKINGYFSNFGFSIWNTCQDYGMAEYCSLISDNWTNKIYLSINIFSNSPYVLINNFFGSNNLKLYGHLVDKSIIFFAGCLISELLIMLSTKKSNKSYDFIKAVLCFTFFIVNPWTYKMIIANWWIIFFLTFFLLGILMFSIKKNKLALSSFFIAGCFDYQSSAGIAFFYFLLIIIFNFKKKQYLNKEYFPIITDSRWINYNIIISLMLPVIIHFVLRFLAGSELQMTGGTSFLTRIGISGNDIHNGGILGSMQFLGGNRITQCLMNFDPQMDLMNVSKSIYVYNCILSTLSMFVVSLISIVGLFFLSKSEGAFFKLIIFPISFLFLSYIFILQQSTSAHLMGYSYFFAALFSVGITSVIFKILEKCNFSLISIFLLTPITIGVILLCIRVSMLTGLNG
tara:strand:- start:6120 stop:7391 length:1272 start_codon:yes stop_codon:yes gene_type:complete